MNKSNAMQIAKTIMGIVLLSLCSQLSAQCTLDSTYEGCFRQPLVLDKRGLEAEAQSTQASGLARANTGTGDSDALSDLASKLRVTLDETDFGDNGQTLPTISWSGVLKDVLLATFFDEDDFANWIKGDHKFTVKLNEPELFSELGVQLDDMQKNELNDELEDWDDVTYSFTWSPVSKRYGRRLSAHSAEFGVLTNSIIIKGNQELATVSNNYRNDFIQIIDAIDSYDSSIPIDELSLAEINDVCMAIEEQRALLARQALLKLVALNQLAPQQAEQAQDALEILLAPGTQAQQQALALEILTAMDAQEVSDELGVANGDQSIPRCDVNRSNAAVIALRDSRQAEIQVIESVEQELNSSLINGFRKLVENQPQWVVELTHRSRDELAGRNESNLKIGYEWSKYNMIKLNTYCDNKGAAMNASCFDEFITNNSEQIDRGARFGFSLEYSDKDKYSFVRAALPQFMLDKEQSLIANAAFSRAMNLSQYLPIDDLVFESARLELSASYEDVSNDLMRNDRAIGKLTLSQKVSENAFMTFGFVYSSKPEYLNDVDEKLSARLGVNFKFGKSAN